MKKMHYTAPQLTLVSFRTERGYASSAIEQLDNLAQAMTSAAEREMSTSWGGENGEENVFGYDNGLGEENSTGLQAGYFGNGSTEGWF